MVQQATRAVPRLDLGAAFMEYQASEAPLIGLQILPIVRTSKQAAKFSKITRESILKRADAKRGPGGMYNRIDMYAEDAEYACKEYGLEAPLGDDERALYASDFDAEEATTRHIWLKLLIEAEIRVNAMIFDATTNWPSGTAELYTDYSGAPWDNAASDIIGQIITVKEKVRKNVGMEPNTLIVGAATLANMLKNTGIKAQFPGAALITLALLRNSLPSIFGLERLLVGGQVYDSAKEGQTYSGTDVWPDDYAMVARLAKEGDPIMEPCVGRSFLWVPDSPEHVTVEQYREEQSRADIFRARHNIHEMVFDPYFAHLMKVDA